MERRRGASIPRASPTTSVEPTVRDRERWSSHCRIEMTFFALARGPIFRVMNEDGSGVCSAWLVIVKRSAGARMKRFLPVLGLLLAGCFVRAQDEVYGYDDSGS